MIERAHTIYNELHLQDVISCSIIQMVGHAQSGEVNLDFGNCRKRMKSCPRVLNYV